MDGQQMTQLAIYMENKIKINFLYTQRSIWIKDLNAKKQFLNFLGSIGGCLMTFGEGKTFSSMAKISTNKNMN